MRNRVIICCMIAYFIANTVKAQKKMQPEPVKGVFLLENQFKDYIPVSPLDFEQDVIMYDVVKKGFDTLSIKVIASDKKRVLQFMPNEAVFATVRKNEFSADAKYGPASITAEAGSYTVTLDYCKFSTLKVMMHDGNCAGFAKVGVGMRITAQITTMEAGVDVSSLIGLGIAAKTGKLQGQLSVDIIGMESSQVTDLITLPVDISEASIQTALQSLSAIKSKIYEDGTRLYPQIVAVKRSESAKGSCSVFDILNTIDIPKQDIHVRTGQSSQPQIQQQIQQKN